MKIYNFNINRNSKCFIVAEIANNHGRNKGRAEQLIKLAAEKGANAVKFQTFLGKDIVSEKQLSSDYDYAPAQKYKYWHQYLDTIAMPFEWYPELIELTHKLGIAFSATPCSIERAKFLVDVGADSLKIASMDNNNIPFLRKVRRLGIATIISGGMIDDKNFESALSALGYPQKKDLAVLHCVSNYPTKPEDMNLLRIKKLQEKYDLPIGFSDHSISNYGAFASVAMGAKIIEKHFTLDRNLEGPDHSFSLCPQELGDLVDGVREIEAALSVSPVRADRHCADRMYRSIRYVKDLEKGTIIKEEHLEIKRPPDGLEPKYYDDVLGKILIKDVQAFNPVRWEDFRD